MIPLPPKKIKALRDEVYEDTIDNGYAATIMLSAFDLIESLRKTAACHDMIFDCGGVPDHYCTCKKDDDDD